MATFRIEYNEGAAEDVEADLFEDANEFIDFVTVHPYSAPGVFGAEHRTVLRVRRSDVKKVVRK